MNAWACLLRGIGGKYTLPSATFVEILEALDAKDVKTYIATGNAVFRSRASRREALAAKIGEAINDRRGFRPEVLLLTPAELRRAIDGNPFPEGEANPPSLHLFFLPEAAPVDPDLEKLESLKADGEQFELRDRVFYLHTPNGIGRSRLAAQVEKRLGTWGTARNWRSACRILELADAL